MPLGSLFGAPIDQVPLDYAEHVVVLPYSSGTTGLPKGVMLTHRNLVANIAQMEHTFTPADDEVALAVLPFFHIYGMQVLMNLLLAFGVRVVTMPRFDMVQALELVQSQRITRFFAVPPMVLGLAKHPVVDDYDLSSIKQIFSGAAPLGADLAAAAAARVGCEVVQGYGMTELSPVSHCTPEGQFRPGTSGVTVSNTEIRIIDPSSGEDLGVGGRGELLVRGPQVMKGYLNNPEATAETLDADGWLHTGDVAVLDDEDHVSIVDRIKELIKYKAFQVPPAELGGGAGHPSGRGRRGRDRRARRGGRGAAQGVHHAGPGRRGAVSGGHPGPCGRAPGHLQAGAGAGGARGHSQERLGQDPAPGVARPLYGAARILARRGCFESPARHESAPGVHGCRSGRLGC